MTIKVCCWQKHFSSSQKFLKFPQQLLVSVEAYLYVKNQTCCFESLWSRLTTSTWNGWINILLLLLPYHKQKTNFITRLILASILTHYFVVTLGIFRHAWPHPPEQPTNIKCFLGPLVISKNSTSQLKVFVRYCSLKNLAFWFVLRFSDHKSRTRFFAKCKKKYWIFILK